MKKAIVAILIVGMLFIFCSCGGGDSERDVARCKGCGKRFYAGDAAGNYMNIAWTNLCNECEAVAKAYGEIKDYYELN